MHTWMAVVIVAVCVLIACVLMWLAAALAYRFLAVRRGATPVVFRALPAADGAGWRHGVLVYGGRELRYFQLTSARMRPDLKLQRTGIALVRKRAPVGSELEIMDPAIKIASFEAEGASVELALDRGSMAAFQSWIESGPPGRSIRWRQGRGR